jgi:predicted phosphate transport protein (TIGR00153 family)
MFNKLIPTNTRFFTLLQESAAVLVQGGEALVEFIDHPERADVAAARLVKLEHDGDTLTHDLFVMLDKSFITPIDREDIHELAQGLDDCLDMIESVTERMQLYTLTTRTEHTRQLAAIIHQQTMQVHAAIAILPGFKYDKVIPHCKEISKLESQADKAGREALVSLFRVNSDPLQVMKWKDIYDYLEGVSDKCKDVAGIVERIVLKHG